MFNADDTKKLLTQLICAIRGDAFELIELITRLYRED